MKIWNIVKIAGNFDSNIYNAWILPNGEIGEIHTAEYGHVQFIYDNPSLFGLSQKQVEYGEATSIELYSHAFVFGAIRAAKHTNWLFIEGNRKDIRKHVETIHKMANSFQSKSIFLRTVEDGMDKEIPVEGLYDI